MTWRVIEADCVEAMSEMDEASVDAIVTDPPAGIGFMGRSWDSDRSGGFVEWLAGVMSEALRVTKPGGHALVWALPRTSHWTGSAIEGAGWEIRDRIAHHFGSGFPKSLNLGNGFGTALKPATEDWWLARKPLVGTVSRNVSEFGTGALNIDECRIEAGYSTGELRPNAASHNKTEGRRVIRDGMPTAAEDVTQDLGYHNSKGRWPANVVLDEAAAAELNRQSGELTSGTAVGGLHRRSNQDANCYGHFKGEQTLGDVTYGDTGGASRFFYCAKSSRSERNAGLGGFEEAITDDGRQIPISNPYLRGKTKRQNVHPTVKPVDLMRWLCRLVTPPGGVCLDPFAGSGTTGIACVLEDFDFIGIEREAEYVEIAKARIDYWAKQPKQLDLLDVA